MDSKRATKSGQQTLETRTAFNVIAGEEVLHLETKQDEGQLDQPSAASKRKPGGTIEIIMIATPLQN